ncbi:MAG: hypothetical protein COU40_01425 [Candidatus Moranbacteria bacterium CG10_big_fil_rev_8_21_14_0_10_35_21]|nr:MAG: hypothetical protein COU40_01425 [Candidatus Moranbacteria bacterium CG10_big_fil_rev_8_21_14_0_10_35_21]PJA88573.1 MAG: hypothetical protein CO139_02445 [Candidatus Moranbacteria bacterium CG_4_9_14_3_um_filter_36_9]
MAEEKNNYDKITESLSDVINAVNLLNEKIDKQEVRLNNLEQKKDAPVPLNQIEATMPQSTSPESAVNQNDVQSTPSVRKQNLEENIGGKWFAKIGIAALVLGVSFFLKYAFDQGWIGETGRVIIGILVGLSLLIIGEKTIIKYSTYGQITS